MTGFGRASVPFDRYSVVVQISSVNRKGLDLTIKLPEEWDSLEADVLEKVRSAAARGKIHTTIEIAGQNGASEAPAWDEKAVNETLERLKAIAKSNGVAFEPTAEVLWHVAQATRKETGVPAGDEAKAVLLKAVDEALKAFSAMRAKEGSALLADFLARLSILKNHLQAVAERAPLVVPAMKEQFLKRLREAGLELNIDDERVLKEVAIFADRSDIAEEITRLRSHLDQFETLLKSNGEIGRKSEFILQEIGREIHTIGSKANDLVLSKHVIELKNELERVKEQIANVE